MGQFLAAKIALSKIWVKFGDILLSFLQKEVFGSLSFEGHQCLNSQ